MTVYRSLDVLIVVEHCVVLISSVLCDWFFYFKQTAAYEVRSSDWSSDVCSSDLALLRHIGVDADYVASSRSYYTVETHIMHLGECKIGTPLAVDTQVLSSDEKRLQLFHSIVNRSEEHTSELQSLMRISYAVFCLKKKNT